MFVRNGERLGSILVAPSVSDPQKRKAARKSAEPKSAPASDDNPPAGDDSVQTPPVSEGTAPESGDAPEPEAQVEPEPESQPEAEKPTKITKTSSSRRTGFKSALDTPKG
jgi:hypothetical protein